MTQEREQDIYSVGVPFVSRQRDDTGSRVSKNGSVLVKKTLREKRENVRKKRVLV